ncbi:MAG: outer membrane beta-barrel protein [Terracidiphilus sp.]|jgi:hypothetical protein
MRLKLFPPLSLALSLFTLIHPAVSQTAPAGYEARTLPITVGVGVSNIDVDWGRSRMYGDTLWIDYFPTRLPHMLSGLGVDVEGRDINYDRPTTVPSNFRQDTAAGGPIYTWRRFPNFQIYGKGLIGFGSIDFMLNQPPYSRHDTRTIYAPGGGFLVHAYKHVWVRADYEYQFWPDFLPHNGTRTDDPQGFTLGAVYDFRGYRH